MTISERAGAGAILHVVDTLETGGLERVVSDLAIAQQASGRRVAVFSILASDGFRTELERAGIPVIIGNKCRSFDRAVLALLRRTLIEQRIGIVHTHNFVPNYHAAIAAFALPGRPLLVNTIHNMGSRLANRRLRWLYRASLLRTARVAMVGVEVREHFVASGLVPAARAATVLNGIPVERFSSSHARRHAARSALGIDADALVIGCVGRLVALKNHAQLIEQIPALLKGHPQLRLVVIGEGPLAADLRRQVDGLDIAAQVLLAGSRSGIADLLPAFDVFVQPSLTEGISIALLEAAASGLAMIATAVGGNTEIIRDGETGLLVPASDGNALRASLDHLLGDAVLRARLGAAASGWVRSHASLQVMRVAYDDFYLAASCSRQ